MIRNGALLISLAVLTFLLIGCSEQEEQAQGEVVRPVKTLLIEQPDLGGKRQFPAVVDASQRVDLSFRVAGKLVDLPVKEGDEVEQGQLVGQLDQTDFELVVQDRQASYDNATKNFERAKRLLKESAIATMDYDRIESELKSAKAALDLANQDLGYTTLTAPFGGSIARRLVENFEEVEAKQPVLELRDLSIIEVRFGIPESIMLRVQQASTTGEQSADPEVVASFDTAPGKSYPLTLKEIATRADPQTQTFTATYVMPAPEDLLVLPGMTASVTADLSQYFGSSEVFLIPVSAVTADNELEGTIWVVDESTMTVAPRKVKVGKMTGSRIEVLEGVKSGDRLVVAGTPYLAEGMKVRLLPEVEQAEPRPDDVKLQNAASS